MSAEEYTVIRRRLIKNVNIGGDEFKVYIITFKAPGLPPSSVFIREEEYSRDVEHKYILRKISELRRRRMRG